MSWVARTCPRSGLLAVLLIFGCAQNPGQKKVAQPESTIPEGGAQVGPAAQQPLATAPGLVSQLAGEWSGSTVIPGYGTAVATANVAANGSGYYVAVVAGQNRSGPFRVLSWDGSWLTVLVDGTREQFTARYEGQKLVVDVTFLGAVELHRIRR